MLVLVLVEYHGPGPALDVEVGRTVVTFGELLPDPDIARWGSGGERTRPGRETLAIPPHRV